jgi:hypothetical protein
LRLLLFGEYGLALRKNGQPNGESVGQPLQRRN